MRKIDTGHRMNTPEMTAFAQSCAESMLQELRSEPDFDFVDYVHFHYKYFPKLEASEIFRLIDEAVERMRGSDSESHQCFAEIINMALAGVWLSGTTPVWTLNQLLLGLLSWGAPNHLSSVGLLSMLKDMAGSNYHWVLFLKTVIAECPPDMVPGIRATLIVQRKLVEINGRKGFAT